MMSNSEAEKLRDTKMNKFIFGLINMPAWPMFHMFLLVTIGGLIFAAIAFRMWPPEVMRDALSSGVWPPPACAGTTWPTFICGISAYFLYRTITFRRLVASVLSSTAAIECGATEMDAIEVSIVLRKTPIGRILAFTQFVFFCSVTLWAGTIFISLYIKLFL